MKKTLYVKLSLLAIISAVVVPPVMAVAENNELLTTEVNELENESDTKDTKNNISSAETTETDEPLINQKFNNNLRANNVVEAAFYKVDIPIKNEHEYQLLLDKTDEIKYKIVSEIKPETKELIVEVEYPLGFAEPSVITGMVGFGIIFGKEESMDPNDPFFTYNELKPVETKDVVVIDNKDIPRSVEKVEVVSTENEKHAGRGPDLIGSSDRVYQSGRPFQKTKLKILLTKPIGYGVELNVVPTLKKNLVSHMTTVSNIWYPIIQYYVPGTEVKIKPKTPLKIKSPSFINGTSVSDYSYTSMKNMGGIEKNPPVTFSDNLKNIKIKLDNAGDLESISDLADKNEIKYSLGFLKSKGDGHFLMRWNWLIKVIGMKKYLGKN